MQRLERDLFLILLKNVVFNPKNLISILGVGNETSCAEFNFYMDPEAAHIVFATLQCPITVLPWECCLEDSIKISKVEI